ncbi:hypothetical protein C0J52_21351 [Blattella germanica]|nr:hypothetical protein C0J52_21351 [Blattella germanica]
MNNKILVTLKERKAKSHCHDFYDVGLNCFYAIEILRRNHRVPYNNGLQRRLRQFFIPNKLCVFLRKHFGDAFLTPKKGGKRPISYLVDFQVELKVYVLTYGITMNNSCSVGKILY